MALDQIELMRHFGFEKFAVVGRDRGGRVGQRMALDNPTGSPSWRCSSPHGRTVCSRTIF